MPHAESASSPYNSNLGDIEAMRQRALQDIWRPDGEEIQRLRKRIKFLSAVVDEPAYTESNRDQLTTDLALLESIESGAGPIHTSLTDTA